MGWLAESSGALQGALAIASIFALILGGLSWLSRQARGGVGDLALKSEEGMAVIPLAAYEARQRELRARIEDELSDAHGAERDRLLAERDEADRRLADLEGAYQEAQRSRDLVRAEFTALKDRLGQEDYAQGMAALDRDDLDEAGDLLRKFKEKRQDAREEEAAASSALGLIAEQGLRWAEAAAQYGDAARLAPDYGRLLKACEFFWRAGVYEQAARFGADLVALARQEGDPRRLATALNEHAVTLQEQGAWEEAERLYREALEIGAETIGKRHPNYATRLNNLAALLQKRGALDEAERLYREALEIGVETIGKRHADYAALLNNLAELLRERGALDEAERLYREALEIGTETIGTRHPNYAIRLNNLAGLLRKRGALDEAERLYREVLEIDAVALGKRHPNYATRLNNLAALLQKRGALDEAERLYREALEIGAETIGKRHPNYASGLNNLAVLYGHMQRFDEAEPLMAEALDIFEARLPPDHPYIAQSRRDLAAIRAAQAKTDAAE